jgi:hypothetical protein
MANGPSVPSVEIMVRNLELLGHTHNIDTSLLAPVAAHFERVGKAAGFLINQYAEYDVLSIQHQVPGGMVGTLKAQLAQQDMMDRLDDVLTETAVVRKELGYPGMATPFSQLVGTTAVLNIVPGKRYSVVPDEVIQYACGYYGEPAGPIDPNIMDKILSSPRAKEVAANPPPQPSIEDLRKQYGTNDDDELILRALVPEADLNKMWAAGPVRRDYPLLCAPELEQARRLMTLARRVVGKCGRRARADVAHHDHERAVPGVGALEGRDDLAEPGVLLGEGRVGKGPEAGPIGFRELPRRAPAARTETTEDDATAARVDGSVVFGRAEPCRFLARYVPGRMSAASMDHHEQAGAGTLFELVREPGSGTRQGLARRHVIHR